MESRRNVESDEDWWKNRGRFYAWLTAANVLGIALFIFVLIWALRYGGGLEIFQAPVPGLLGIHMVLMVLFVVFLHGIGSLVYRILPKANKFSAKLIHAGLHFIVVIGGGAGLAAAVEMHESDPEPKHFYSVHSWLGLTTLLIYGLQFLGGLSALLLQIPPAGCRKWTIPKHRLVGQVVLYFACGAVITGLFNASSDLPSAIGITVAGIELNIGALIAAAYTFSVLYLLTQDAFRRPRTEETEPLLQSQQSRPFSTYYPYPPSPTASTKRHPVSVEFRNA